MILWGVSMQTIFRDVEAKHWAEQLGLSSLHLHCFVCCYFWLVCLFIFNAVTSRMATSCCRALLAQAVVHKLLPPYRIGTVVPVVLTQVMSPCPSLYQLTPYKCNSAICADSFLLFLPKAACCPCFAAFNATVMGHVRFPGIWQNGLLVEALMIAGISAPWAGKGRTSPVLTRYQQRPDLHQRKSPGLVFLPVMTLLLVVTTFVELSDKNFIFTRLKTFVKQ